MQAEQSSIRFKVLVAKYGVEDGEGEKGWSYGFTLMARYHDHS